MELFLNLTASAVMLALIALIALRAWQELIQGQTEPASPEQTLPGLRTSAFVFAASLAVLWLGAYTGHILSTDSFTGFGAHFLGRFTVEGDAPRYLFMAENGYVTEGEYVNNIVFYPLYPLLIRGVSVLLGGRMELAGILISQLCYALAGVVLFRMACRLCRAPAAALFAFWLYPFGFFALGVYTEGLFLLLSLACLSLLLRERWLGAGAAGLLCALTRSQGMLLVLPGVYLAWRALRQGRKDPRMAAALAPLHGFFLYLCINKAVCGSFFAFTYYESQPPWWQTAQWVGKTVAQQWNMAFAYPGIARWIYWPQLALYFLAAVMLFLAWRRRQDNALTLYATGYLGMCYTASWLISGGRYMFGCVPLFLVVGNERRIWARRAFLAAELALFILFNTYFMQGQCIM